ncbi:MAG TPA: hypothetical protein VFX03_12380 [Thermomicrobiales bacterium]|nr:hypothetical protein [Thermomicrobiales bacterium]
MLDGAQGFAVVGSERGDENQADDVARVRGCIADDRAAVRMTDGQDRAGNLIDAAGHIRGVVGDAAQWIGRRDYIDAGSLQALDDAVPTRAIGEGAVDEDDGEGSGARGGGRRGGGHGESFLTGSRG